MIHTHVLQQTLFRDECSKSRLSQWLLMGLCAPLLLFAQPPLTPAWRKAYEGNDAAGKHVIALWQFEGATPLADASGNGHDLSLRGDARLSPDGRFGAGLESFGAGPGSDSPQGATARNAPSLTPPGPFTIDLWARLRPEAAEYAMVYLIDKKNYFYASDLPKANRDYCLYLNRVGTSWRLMACLGFGTESETFSSSTVALGKAWHHLAFSYDGAGTGCFYVDGRRVGRGTREGRGAVVAGQYAMTLGDRCGSVHRGFPGTLDQVRIRHGAQVFFSGELSLVADRGRTVFRRFEEGAEVLLTLSNDTGKELAGGRVAVSLDVWETEIDVPAVPAAEQRELTIPVNTALRPGEYTLAATFSGTSVTGEPCRATVETAVRLLPRPTPNRMPVVMWGTGDVDVVAEIGFTHQLLWMGYFDGAVFKRREAVPDAMDAGRREAVSRSLDRTMRQGLGAVIKLYPGSWLARQKNLMKTYQRIDREGKPYSRTNVCASFPDIPEFGYLAGASPMQAFGAHPAIQACMIHSEIRDGTAPCFHDHDTLAFLRDTGITIPEEIVSKTGVRWQDIEAFPADRIISPDHPILTYYRWFWKSGDGWNAFHSAVHHGVKSTGRRDVWTYHDPAVRVPSVWGSGGEVDVISQWTYCYPDPIKIGEATDELFAMAAGRPGQQVMSMTQMIWKRFQTCVGDTPAAKLAAWETEQPDAKYFTIAPDHLREAFWAKISRPVSGIMYHGWGSLVKADGKPGTYRFTNAGARSALAELIHTVVEPLGPALLRIPDPPTEVALLHSFSSQMFAGRGTYGWSNGWEADMHLVLQWAHLQPRIMYDEAVRRDGLGQFKVLVLPNCDVLTVPVAARIRAFQDAGGIVVADEHIAPGILPDIQIPAYARTGKADVDKQALQQLARRLRTELDTVYSSPFTAASQDLVLRRRIGAGADYLFALNDKRTFGTYVGQHGKVMEKGLPLESTIRFRRPGGVVYDLVAHRRVPASREGEFLSFPCVLPPGGGNIYMICDSAIETVRVAAPTAVRLEGHAVLTITVTNTEGREAAAIIPMRVDILDPGGRAAEYSGWYGAAQGRLRIDLDLAVNDEPGVWTVRATELASGIQSTASFRYAAGEDDKQ